MKVDAMQGGYGDMEACMRIIKKKERRSFFNRNRGPPGRAPRPSRRSAAGRAGGARRARGRGRDGTAARALGGLHLMR